MIAERLRKLAQKLRKLSALEVRPKPIPNPVASRAKGDLGSLAEGPKPPSPGKFAPKIPKPFGGSDV